MRPTLLEIEGFTCYRDKQTLTFDDVDGPMAISGATGSGKSTLLDAMLYALYGRVPRVNHQVAQLVSTGRKKAAIRFEFRLGGREYRVVRTLYSSNTAATAQLEGINPEVRMADGVRDVGRAIEELLGLGLDAFVQSVVLPQGQFAKFLKAEPKARRDLLFSLMGGQIYTAMQQRATRLAQDNTKETEALASRLAEDFDGATPEALETQQARVAELETCQTQLELREKTLVEDLDRLKNQRQLTVRLEQAEAKRRQLDIEAPEIEAHRASLRSDRTAAEVVPLHTAATEAEEAVVSRAKALEQAGKDHETAATAADTARRAHDEAVEAAAAIPQWRTSLTELIRIEGRLEQVTQAASHAARMDEDLTAAEQRLKNAQDILDTEQAKRRDTTEARRVAQEQLAELAYDAAEHDALSRVRNKAERLATLVDEGAARARTIEEAARSEATGADAVNTAEASLTTAWEGFTRARDEVDQALDALTRAKDAERAAALRAHLHGGDTCPVCEQTVDEVPASLDSLELTACERRLADARGRLTSAEATRDVAAKQLTEAQAGHEKTVGAHEAARRAEADAQAEIMELEAVLRAAIVDADPEVLRTGSAQLAAHVCDRLAHLDASKRPATEAERTCDTCTATLTHLDSAIENAERQLALADADRANLRPRVVEAADALTRARADVGDHTPESVSTERSRLKTRIEAAEGAVTGTAFTLNDARTEETRAQGVLTQARTEHGLAVKEAARRHRAAVDAAAVHGFDSPEAAAAARLDPATRDATQSAVDYHVAARTAVADTLRETGEALGDTRIPQSTVDDTAAALKTAQSERTQVIADLATAQNEVTTLTERLARATTLTERLSITRDKAELYTDLAAELRSNRFPEWLLQTEFDDLLRHASERLYKFTGRYTLKHEDRKFLVVDHDNAMEARSTDTLSGGETFLCSLALALELSDQIQRRAGSRRFDCLFIDEGFGTLDPDTLDTVAEALEVLGAGDRLVGLISHVGSLTERMPWRIVVTKGPAGSSATLTS